MSPSRLASKIYEGSPTNENSYDLICIGFGPASLAIAVALRDLDVDAKVLFLERQSHFAWHAGMLIPSAKMQISFLKDLATFRDPRSHFTFINYLKTRGRLEAFANLGTFFPLREEFNDYLTWAASYFNDVVRYSTEAQSIQAIEKESNESVNGWLVTCQNLLNDTKISIVSKKVVVAVGGAPKVPRGLHSFGPKFMHSSQYLQAISNIPQKDGSLFRFAVIGAGQSAAEIFEDLSHRFPKAHIKLFIAASALKPSDDSPLWVTQTSP